MERQRSAPARPGAGLREVTTAWSAMATDMAEAVEGFLDAVTTAASSGVPTTRPTGRHRPAHRWQPEPCKGCRTDPCQCRCCITDADLVVYARVGELRVVPIRISNPRVRTRRITLELGGFTSSGGHEVPIRGALLTRSEFDLEACEHEDAIVVIEATSTPDTPSVERLVEQGRLDDVDDCVVGYADLRIQGCDVRPVRLAVALLPRDCEAHEVECGCGCC